jgi:hypothetical protein
MRAATVLISGLCKHRRDSKPAIAAAAGWEVEVYLSNKL